MDLTEDSLPPNCIILSPEELVKLGVKLENPVSANRPVSTITNAKKKKVKEHIARSVGKNTPDQTNLASCSKSIKVTDDCKRSPSRKCETLNAGIVIDRRVSDKETNIADDNKTLEMERNAKNNLEPINNDDGTMEKRKTTFADDSLRTSGLNLETHPIKKRQMGRPKKTLSPLTKKCLIVNEIKCNKLPLDPHSKVKNSLKSLKGDISKNNKVKTSIHLNQIVSNNGSVKNFGKNCNQLDNSDGKFQDEPQPSSCENDKKIEVQKRGKGRPKNPNKIANQDCCLNVQQDTDVEERCEVASNKQQTASISSGRLFNENTGIIKDNSKNVRKSRIKKYKDLNSDLDYNSDVNYDHDSDTSYTRKNDEMETSLHLSLINSNSSEVDKKNEVLKRGRRRPRKSIPSEMTNQDDLLNVQLGDDVENKCDVALTKQKRDSISSGRYSDIINDKSKNVRKSRIQKYNVLNSDIDSNSDANDDHDSDTSYKSKNDEMETSIHLSLIKSNNGHPSSENTIIKKYHQLDDSNVKFQDEPQPSSSEVDKKPEVLKRGRGRPRKSIPSVMTNQDDLLNVQLDTDVEKTCDIALNKQRRASISSDRSFNESSDIIGDNPKQVRKSRIKKYNVLDSDIDSNSDVNDDHDSNTSHKSKNDEMETSIHLNLIKSNNGHPSSENTISKKFNQLDDSNGKFQDEPQPSSSQVDKKTEVLKRGRGRPRKSIPCVMTNPDDLLKIKLDNDVENTGDVALNKQRRFSISSDRYFNENSEIIGDNPKQVRKSRIKKYNVLNSDIDSSSDVNYDHDSNTAENSRTKKRRKDTLTHRKIIDSDSNFDSDSSRDEITPEQMQEKAEAADANGDKIQNISNVSLTLGNETSIICEETKAPRKRGRPKKNSLEASKTSVSCTPVTQHIEIDDSLLTISKRGRKRKEVNYSLLENPDFPEYESNNQTRPLSEKSMAPRRVGRPKKNSLQDYAEYQPSPDIKIEADGIQYPSTEIVNDGVNEELLSLSNREKDVYDNSNEGNEESAKSSSRYKWTGNATKAITQMFHAIRDNSIPDLSRGPVPGKNKRTGRSTECVDDVNGFSVCMVCNETIPNPQWPKHKRKIHYNLAWRKGDLSLDLSNDAMVLKTLKQLFQEQGFIKCNRCAKKIKSAKRFVRHLELCNGVVNSSGCVTCAVCKTSMEKTSWHHHSYRQHNNLAWREGDPPLNLEDQEFVLRILNALYKARKPLHCEKCDLQKKSVLGYLSHKSICQKTEEELDSLKVTCEKCGKKVLPVSMDYHLKTHEEKESKFDLLYSSYFDLNVGVSGKRRAARQALQTINSIKGQAMEEAKYYTTLCDFQESFVDDILSKRLLEHSPLKCIFADCDFSADVVETMTHHMGSCRKRPDQVFTCDQYIDIIDSNDLLLIDTTIPNKPIGIKKLQSKYILCKMCLFWCEAESTIYEHIRAQHNKSFKGEQDVEYQSDEEQNDSEEDRLLDDEDREKKRLRLMGKHKIINHLNARVKPLFLMVPVRQRPNLLLYRQAYAWMWEFCERNYKFNLYQYVRNDRPWQLLDCDLLSDYLPKNSQSCDIASKLIKPNDSPNDINGLIYRKLDLFEICNLYEGDITIFCGGPISALAWLPTLYSEKTYNQVLAVAVFNSMESYYTTDKYYQEPCVIQFWSFGILNCYKNDCPQPYLLFGMAVPYGPIWHLEWCPSGCLDCFQEDITCRLGLLAIAASDSYVYIYSIDNLPDANNRGLIYKGEPVLKLQLEFDKSPVEGQGYYPTKISWSKAQNHRYIAVGYSTGLVAVYDLTNESLLLQRGNKAGTNIVFPYKSFQAHYSSITALTLSHLSGGNRLLFSASFDRSSVYWDLDTMTKITAFKKHTIADGVWITQWPSYLVTEDESTFTDKTYAHSFNKTIRHFMSPEREARNFTFSCSGIKTLSFSDWLNTILHGSNAGEVMAQFTHRMFCYLDSKNFKTMYTKSIFSLTKLIKKDISVQELATTYDKADKKYKVVFLDYSLNKLDDTPNSSANKKLTDEKLDRCDVREYGLQGINKVAFNPNPQACAYYAVGYQAGFLRLQCIQFVCPLLR